jgi:hypothetical protein
MKWEKQGLVFVPDGNLEWSRTHAQVPVVDIVDNNKWRIYYATRNENNKSTTSYIEVEAGNPSNILYKHDKPILLSGSLGAFDENGIMPSSIINKEGKKYLYYIGWSQRKSVPYQNSIGVAVSDDDGKTFNKFSEGPIIGVNNIDPFFTGTFFVMKDGDIFKGYYLSCVEWKIVDDKPEPTYVLKYATSTDAINWTRNNIIAIPFKDEKEGGLVSASVLKLGKKYSMWFGYRNYFDFRSNTLNSYRIGFAESTDAVNWTRDDSKSGIDISQSGWDSEMISYPYVIAFEKKLYLFYNGNQFGKTGFGYATLNIN